MAGLDERHLDAESCVEKLLRAAAGEGTPPVFLQEGLLLRGFSLSDSGLVPWAALAALSEGCSVCSVRR